MRFGTLLYSYLSLGGIRAAWEREVSEAPIAIGGRVRCIKKAAPFTGTAFFNIRLKEMTISG
jgi:hypothetical protein